MCVVSLAIRWNRLENRKLTYSSLNWNPELPVILVHLCCITSHSWEFQWPVDSSFQFVIIKLNCPFGTKWLVSKHSDISFTRYASNAPFLSLERWKRKKCFFFFFGLFVSIQCLRGAFRILSEMACFQNHCATTDSMSSTFDPHMCELIQFAEFISKFNLFETSKLH